VARHGDQVKDFIDQVKEYMAQTAIQDGVSFDGFKVVESRTNRRIKNTDTLERAIREAGHMALAYEPKLKAMSKLIKALGDDFMAPHIEKPPGSPVLVPVEDRRAEMAQTQVNQIPDLNGPGNSQEGN